MLHYNREGETGTGDWRQEDAVVVDLLALRGRCRKLVVQAPLLMLPCACPACLADGSGALPEGDASADGWPSDTADDMEAMLTRQLQAVVLPGALLGRVELDSTMRPGGHAARQSAARAAADGAQHGRNAPGLGTERWCHLVPARAAILQRRHEPGESGGQQELWEISEKALDGAAGVLRAAAAASGGQTALADGIYFVLDEWSDEDEEDGIEEPETWVSVQYLRRE